MSIIFSDPNYVQTTKAALHTLWQGGQPIPTMLLNFIIFSSDTKWNEAAQHHHFRLGLNEDIKDEFAWMEPLSSLNNLIDLCIRINFHLMEHCH